MPQVLSAFVLAVWYAIQLYILGSCAYVLSSAALFLLFRNRIKGLFSKKITPEFAAGQTRFLLLVPAHNEERLLPALLASIRRLEYPAARYQTVVIADNCTDQTAAVAAQASVACLERRTVGPSSKAQALQFAIAELAIQAPFTDAVICIIDADCTLEKDYLTELDKLYARPGAAPVVQAYRSVSNAFASDVTVLDAASEALRQWVQSGTRKWLGQSAFVFGLGCSMRESVFATLAALPLTSLAEDKEWKVYLTAQKIPVDYCPTARLSYEVVSDSAAFQKQRSRWLAGYYESFKNHGVRMLLQGIRRGNLAQLDLAAELLQPPRSILWLATAVFGLLAWAFEEYTLVSAWVWLGIVVAFGLYGALGLWLIGARPRYYLMLFSCFRLMGVVVKATAAIVLGRGVAAWDATRRESPKA